VAAYAASVSEQRVVLFKEIFPELRKIWVFYDANNTFSRSNFAVTEAAAKKAGCKLSVTASSHPMN